MRPNLALASVPLLLLVSSCCWPRKSPQVALDPFQCDPPKPGECRDVSTDGTVYVEVDARGNVSLPCIEIDAAANRILWRAAPGTALEELQILFKNRSSAAPPPDPLCSGALCVLDRPAAPAERTYCYAVVYRVKGEPERAVDPKLIIKR